MLTGHGTVDLCRRAFKSGAAEFLEKPVDDDVLLEALQKAVRQHVRSRERVQGDRGARERYAQLTEREREVMALILDGKLNKQIAEALDISIKTVEVHRARVLEKMAVKSAVELAGRLSSLRQEP
jgi:FixJ family two-component response regulator